ncbi:MAG TPA: methyl-accepting chemotaxis protein, partial [Methylophilaceae bacterium]
MAWLKNMKTGTKLSLGFGTMIILLGMTMVISYTAITTIRDSQQRLSDKEFVGVVDVVGLKADLNRQQVRMLEIMLTPDHTKQELLLQDIRDRAQRIDQTLQELATVYSGNSKFLLKLNEVKAVLTDFRQIREENIKLIFAGKIKEARQTIESTQAERYEKMRSITIELEQDLQGQVRKQIVASAELAARSIRMFMILGGLALLLAIALTMVFSRLISQLVLEITDAAKRMAAGDLTTNLMTEARTDEIGELRLAFTGMTEDLRTQIRGLAEGANLLDLAASEIVSSTTQLSASTSESAVAVSET